MKKCLFLFLLVIFLLIGCQPKQTFVINFYDGDGTLLDSQKLEEGSKITPPTLPEREGYDFIGWDKEFELASQNLNLIAEYRIKNYTVQFFDIDGNEVSKQMVEYQAKATAPTLETIKGKTFKGWDKDFSNVTQDLKIYPLYEPQILTVSFLSYDGSILKQDKVEYDKAAIAPDNPSREGYTFVGWDKDFSQIQTSLVVNAIFEINRYTVTFVNYDGSVLESIEVNYGAKATPIKTPTRPGYLFKNWDQDLSVVKKEMTVHPVFELESYTVSFANITKVKETTWSNKEVFLQEFYTDLNKWLTDNIEKIPELTKTNNTFTMTKSTKTATWSTIAQMRALDPYDVERTIGTLIYKPFTRSDNKPITPPIDNNYFLNTEPYRTKYMDLDQYFLNVINTAYTAYNKGYTPDSNGRVQIFFRFQQWNYGIQIPSFDTLPKKYELLIDVSKVFLPESFTYTIEDTKTIPNPVYEGLTFLGWFDNTYGAGNLYTEITDSVGNKTLYARWDTDPTKHEVTFLDQDYKLLKQVIINDGETVNAPTITAKDGYTFIGWDKDMKNIKTDITFMAQYEKTKYTIIFDANIDDDKAEIPENLTYTIEDKAKLPSASLQGYFFLGWFDNPEGNGTEITNTTKGNLTLYAKWLKIPVENGDIDLIASETILTVGSSTNLYVKRNNAYLSPTAVKFTSSDSTIAIINENGFILTKKAGIVTFLAMNQGEHATIEITITESKQPIKWVGHQGSGGPVVQNTVSAFEEGGKRGYFAMECDVRVSSDGIYYICHDDVFKDYLFVDTTLIGKAMGGYKWDDLKTYQVKDTYDGKTYYGYLAIVEEYLAICKKYNAKAVLELKWTNGINSNDQSKLPGLVELVKKAGMYENAIFMTSMINCLTYLREHYPDITLQYLTGESTTTMANVQTCINNRFSIDAISSRLTKEMVDLMHEAGLYVNAYTVNDQNEANKLIAMGVDMITTDNLGK